MDDNEKALLMDLILERVFQSMPKMMALHMQQETLLREAADGLFQRRPDLKARSLEVALMMNNIFAAEPGLDLQGIIKKVEESELWKN